MKLTEYPLRDQTIQKTQMYRTCDAVCTIDGPPAMLGQPPLGKYGRRLAPGQPPLCAAAKFLEMAVMTVALLARPPAPSRG